MFSLQMILLNLGYAVGIILSYAVIPEKAFIYLHLNLLNSGRFEGEDISNSAISIGIKYKL